VIAHLRQRWRVVAVALALLAFALWLRLGPLPPDLLASRDDSSTIVVDRNGVPLYEARSISGARSARLSPDALPGVLVDATIAAEDRRFYLHPGIDPIAILRALARDIRAGRIVEGASTITQQVAKLLLDARHSGPRARGVRGKLHEALIALRLEHRFSKREILSMYMDLAPYGNQVVGAARASEVYFGVKPSMLTLAQAAFLAGLPQRPSAYSPYKDVAGVARQRAILDRMLRQRRISMAQAEVARSERLRFQPLPAAFVAPHFVEMVLAGRDRRSGGRIETTLDVSLQAEVAGILSAERDNLERHGAYNVAVAVLDNASAEWLAWEGSGRYFDRERGGAINGVLALRQPGSALNPFTYALAFETGATPATVLPDIPASYPTADPGVVYAPRNYDGAFHGPLRIRKALAGSQNVPAVELASRIGVPDVLRFLKTSGFTSLDRNAAHYGLGLTLGNAEVTLAELVGAYAALARGGEWREPHATKDEQTVASRRVMSPRAAYWVTDVLSDPDARAYVFGRGGSLELPFTVAAKTGTSQAYRDNWAIGYTRDVTVGVWVGNFDRRPLTGSSGVTGAGPIFHAVMLAAVRHARAHGEAHDTIVGRPGDLTSTEICELSGMRSGAACPSRRREWLPAATSPLPCSWHHASENGLLTLWPDEYRHWAADRGLLAETPSPATEASTPVRTASSIGAQVRRFAIVSPPNGAVYLVDPTLRREFQAVSLRASGTSGRVEWRVNGKPVGVARADGRVRWPLAPGEHRVTARDARGRSAEVAIRVK
jgi:penicillin-binding protein 1C